MGLQRVRQTEPLNNDRYLQIEIDGERQRSIETERSEDLQRGPLSIKLSADRYMCVRKLRETRGKTT